MRYAWFALAALVVAVVSILGLRDTPRTRPPLEVFPDMDRQPKYKPQAESRFFADGRTERPVPAGVIARGRTAAADPAFGGLDGHFARGYRGANASAQGFPADGDPPRFGDEPVLLAERSGAPVWIGRDRVAAARGLLAAHPDCDVLVCDDGLQHYALARDLEIAVEDERGHGNGLLLPAGPLREPASRAVDAVVVNGGAAAGTFEMRLVPDGLRRVGGRGEDIPLALLRGKRLHAVAGIGNPARFFATLRVLGLEFVPHAFPDHHAWRADELDFADCDIVLMTEKDAVKCRAFGRDDLVALRVQARVDPRLADLLAARIHGPQAA
jgi:tetraacyldisaccharide 4'-kinase